jgi:tetratricopeptide (TPR) repeat protein
LSATASEATAITITPPADCNAHDQADQGTEAILDLVREGKEALARGNLDGALANFAAVVRRFPDRAEGHNNLGALYTSLGRFAEAETCFARVLDLLPDNGNVHYNRGIVRIRLGKHEQAAADFQATLATAPEDADCWNNLGVAAHLQGDHAAAAAHFRRALELAPAYTSAVLNLCDTELTRGRLETAVTACDEFLAIGQDAEVRERLAELLLHQVEAKLVRAEALLEATPPADTRATVSHPAAPPLKRRIAAARQAINGTPDRLV